MFLAQRFKTIQIDVIVASPYPRTRDTAEIFNQELKRPVEYSDLIVEMSHPSELLGLPKDDPVRKEIARLRADPDRGPKWKYSNEESSAELRSRATRALSYLSAIPHERVAVITHGGIMRTMLAITLHGSSVALPEFQNIFSFLKTTNTGITVCTYDSNEEIRSGWHMLTYNDHAHLGEMGKFPEK